MPMSARESAPTASPPEDALRHKVQRGLRQALQEDLPPAPSVGAGDNLIDVTQPRRRNYLHAAQEWGHWSHIPTGLPGPPPNPLPERCSSPTSVPTSNKTEVVKLRQGELCCLVTAHMRAAAGTWLRSAQATGRPSWSRGLPPQVLWAQHSVIHLAPKRQTMGKE